jgi:hypothetical protein
MELAHGEKMKNFSSPSAEAIRRQAREIPVLLTHESSPWSHATPPGIGGGKKQKENKKKK